MYCSGNGLFDSEMSLDYFNSKIANMRTEALSLEDNIFESNTVEEIKRNFFQKYEIEPIKLFTDQKDLDIDEIEMHYDSSNSPLYIPGYDDSTYTVRGYRITVTIPFDGCQELFRLKPSSCIMRTFDASIHTDNFDSSSHFLKFEIKFEKIRVDNDANVINNQINDEIAKYQKNISYLNTDVSDYNRRLESEISKSIDSRLLELDKLKALKTALKIPLKKSSSPSPLNRIHIKPKIISPLAVKSGDNAAYISEDDYDVILSSIRNMGTSMESNRAAEKQDEEGLRDILLAGLSASIKIGNASGESFRKTGKTDISVVFENKAAFIAECKLWKGKEYINKGIDQLLKYTTWRDVKVSYIIFNKDVQNFSRIQEQIPSIFSEREDFIRSEGNQRDGEWRFTLQKPDDDYRHITIHVFAFDVKTNNADLV